MKKGTELSGGAVFIGASPVERTGVLADLKYLSGKNNPNFVHVFSHADQLPVHLVERIKATIAKRVVLFAILYAEGRKDFSLQIGGALKQDRSGVEGEAPIKGYCNGVQAGHIAIGTYSINGMVIGQEGGLFLRQHPNHDPKKSNFPNYSNLLAYALALDGATELVPAFINQSMGKIESIIMHYMKGLIPVYIPNNQTDLEKQLICEANRMVNFFIDKKVTFLKPLMDRLNSIVKGRASEFIQNPADKNNLIFNGKESGFIQAVLDLLNDPASEFYIQLESRILRNIAINAADFAMKAECAKRELSGTSQSA